MEIPGQKIITDAVWNDLFLPDFIFDISLLLPYMGYFYHLKQRHVQALCINFVKVHVQVMMWDIREEWKRCRSVGGECDHVAVWVAEGSQAFSVHQRNVNSHATSIISPGHIATLVTVT